MNKRRPAIKRTTNRKTVIKTSTLKVNGQEYAINTGKKKQFGIYREPMERMINQVQICRKKWGGRLFGLRQELHMPHTTENNKAVSLFMSRLIKRLKRTYGLKDVGYFWAREYHGLGKG